MSYYNQPPVGPYPPTNVYMGQATSGYPPLGYPPGIPMAQQYASPYNPAPSPYPSAYPPTYPFALHPSFPQPYPSPYYQQQPPPHSQPQVPYNPYQQPSYPSALSPYQPAVAAAAAVGVASSVAQPPGPPQPAAVSSTALQMDSYGLPQVPGDAPLQYPQTFRVEEKVVSATRDSFTVRDQQGALRYKVDGHFSINERKVIKDMHGQVLLKLREARLKMREKITIFNASNIALLTLQKTSAIQIGSKRVNGYLGGHPSGTPIVVITGNHNNTHFRVMNAQNQEIADIRRKKFSWKNMLTDQDTYDVTIHFGSPALVCFITVALDEIYED